MTDRLEQTQRKRQRRPLEASEITLRKAALHYLERYSASAAQVKRILMSKVERSARFHGTDRAEGEQLVDQLIVKLIASGLLDDRVYAAALTRGLHRRGTSAKAIRYKLAAKGVAAELVEAALSALEEEAGAPELAAAIAYARRRRLGPYRAAEQRDERRDRDLAALARAGFAYGIARAVIEAADPADLEVLLAESRS